MAPCQTAVFFSSCRILRVKKHFPGLRGSCLQTLGTHCGGELSKAHVVQCVRHYHGPPEKHIHLLVWPYISSGSSLKLNTQWKKKRKKNEAKSHCAFICHAAITSFKFQCFLHSSWNSNRENLPLPFQQSTVLPMGLCMFTKYKTFPCRKTHNQQMVPLLHNLTFLRR